MIYLRTSMWLTFFTQWHHCFHEKPSPLLLSSPVATKAFLVSSLLNVVAGSYIWLTRACFQDGPVKSSLLLILLCTFLSSFYLCDICHCAHFFPFWKGSLTSSSPPSWPPNLTYAARNLNWRSTMFDLWDTRPSFSILQSFRLGSSGPLLSPAGSPEDVWSDQLVKCIIRGTNNKRVIVEVWSSLCEGESSIFNNIMAPAPLILLNTSMKEWIYLLSIYDNIWLNWNVKLAENDCSKRSLSSASTGFDTLFTNFVTLLPQTLLNLFSSSVQVSKTDPSPKREMPTMILFNVVFALRVRNVISVFLHLLTYLKLSFRCCGRGPAGLCLCLIILCVLYLRAHKSWARGGAASFGLVMLPVRAARSACAESPYRRHRKKR